MNRLYVTTKDMSYSSMCLYLLNDKQFNLLNKVDSSFLEYTYFFIEKIKSTFDIPISLDTYKSKVAFAGIQAGADLINDIWGLKYDPNMAEVIAQGNVACCLMHNRKEAVYKDFMEDVLADLTETVSIAKGAKIQDDKIILDPGVGFAKDVQQNLP